MPQSVRYIARRSVISGHVVGGVYGLNLYLTTKDQESRLQAERATALVGRVYTTFHSAVIVWECETRPMSLSESNELREFLRSAQDGQVLQFDPYWWTGASPSSIRSVVLDQGRYSESRSIKRGGDQTGDCFTFRFTLLEVP